MTERLPRLFAVGVCAAILALLAFTNPARAATPPPETLFGKDIFAWADAHDRQAAEVLRLREVLRAERGRVRRLGRLVRKQRRQLYHARKGSGAPTVKYALRLASVVYGVPYAHLRSVAWCESKLDAYAVNGRYRGVMQEGPMFEAGPFGRTGFSVYDPVANVMTAAYTVRRDGSWRQWACRP